VPTSHRKGKKIIIPTVEGEV